MINCLYDCFKKWSATGSVYIISDFHFDDPDCKLMNPNWPSSEEQINILKKMCHKPDTLICLGDVGNPEPLKELKCYKVLIKGNHDVGSTKYKDYFDEIYGGPLFIADRIVLSHEPLRGIDCALNIHGHLHNRYYIYENKVNVCADVINFTPQSLGEMIKKGYLGGIKDIHREVIDRRIV